MDACGGIQIWWQVVSTNIHALEFKYDFLVHVRAFTYVLSRVLAK